MVIRFVSVKTHLNLLTITNDMPLVFTLVAFEFVIHIHVGFLKLAIDIKVPQIASTQINNIELHNYHRWCWILCLFPFRGNVSIPSSPLWVDSTVSSITRMNVICSSNLTVNISVIYLKTPRNSSSKVCETYEAIRPHNIVFSAPIPELPAPCLAVGIPVNVNRTDTIYSFHFH